MKSSNRPAGPGKPAAEERAQADEREEIDEAFSEPPAGNPRDGRAPTRNQPSPAARNENVPERDDRSS